jgi:pyruvate formate lyase activating enzyme
MKIGGFTPFTLSDYPGKVAALVFTQGCNFRCPFCHNGSLMPMDGHSFIMEDDIYSFLQKRRNFLDGVVVTGGEPTIQNGLMKFLRHIKKEIGLQVKLDTNGSRPIILRELFEAGLVDYVAMDIKAPLCSYNKLAGLQVAVERVEESINLISQSGIEHEFRTTVVKSLLSEGDVEGVRKLVPEGSTLRLQKFCPENAYNKNIKE